MSLKFIMNKNGTIAHDTGSAISGGSFSISSAESTNVKAGGEGVHKTPLLYTFSGGNASGFVPGSVQTTAPQTITATAQKVKADGALVMRVDDSGTMNCIGTIPPPTGGTAPVSGPVKIDDAGQDKAKGQ